MTAGALAALVLAGRRPRLAVAAATAAAAGLALGSHAAALGAVPMLVIAVHLGCASLWAGTVLAAAIAVRRRAATGLLRRLAPVLAPAVAGLAVDRPARARPPRGERGRPAHEHVRAGDPRQDRPAARGRCHGDRGARRADRREAGTRPPGRPPSRPPCSLLALGGAALLAAGAPARGPQFAPPAQAAASVIETRQLDDLIVSVEVKPNRPGRELRRDPRDRHPPTRPPRRSSPCA